MGRGAAWANRVDRNRMGADAAAYLIKFFVLDRFVLVAHSFPFFLRGKRTTHMKVFLGNSSDS